MNESKITLTLLNNEIDLDDHCWKCKDYYGRLKNEYSSGKTKCDICNDSGFVLTDNGQAILSLLERHKK